MANKRFWLGMLIMALVFGTALIGCDTGGDMSVGSGDVTYTVEANGTLDEETSSQLNFTFSAAVSGLMLENITITENTGKAEKNGRAIHGTLIGSDTSWILNITNVTAGKIRISIDKKGIERGRKTVIVHKDSATGEGPEQAIKLSDGLWEEGSLADRNDVRWYKFEAEQGEKYRVQWQDAYGSLGGGVIYRASIKITAYKSDHQTIIDDKDDINNYLWTISGVSGTVFLKVEYLYSSGSFAIRFFDPANMGPQDFFYISSVTATIAPSVIVSWWTRSETIESTGYRVYRSDTKDGTYKLIAEVTDSSTYTYIDTDKELKAGKTYWYKVAGYNSKGEGEKSEPKESEIIPDDNAIALILGTVTPGEIEVSQEDWYKFTAEPGKTYKVQWEANWENSLGSWWENPDITGLIQVSAFIDTTPIDDFQALHDYGWSEPKTISGVSGTVYLKVEVYSNNPGTYTIKVYEE